MGIFAVQFMEVKMAIPISYKGQGFCTSPDTKWCKYILDKACPGTCGYAVIVKQNVWEGDLAQLVQQEEEDQNPGIE